MVRQNLGVKGGGRGQHRHGVWQCQLSCGGGVVMAVLLMRPNLSPLLCCQVQGVGVSHATASKLPTSTSASTVCASLMLAVCHLSPLPFARMTSSFCVYEL
jgi:hypothetical protein